MHRFDMDDRYAYISTEMDGYRVNILVNYDISDPTSLKNNIALVDAGLAYCRW